MSLNNFGLGINVSAKDTASATLAGLGAGMTTLATKTKTVANAAEGLTKPLGSLTPTLMGIAKGFDSVTTKAQTTAAAIEQVAKGATQMISAKAMKAAENLSAGLNASGKAGRTGTTMMTAREQKAAAALTAPPPAAVAANVGGQDKTAAATGALFSLETMREVRGRLQEIQGFIDRIKASLLGVFERAAGEATRFGQSVASVASITDRATFPMETIEKIGKDMTATYGGDLNLQVQTLYQAVSSGATNAAEATALMDAANKLAIGGMSDSFKAVDALTNVLNAYSMKMTQAAEVSDALFVTAKIGKTTIDELAQQIGRVAPTAAAMGVSLNNLFAVVTAGSTQLGNASASIDGFKEMLSAVLKPTADAEKEAKRMGIDFSSAGIKAAGGWDKFFNSIIKNGKFADDTIQKLWGGSMTAFNLASVLAGHNGKAFADALDGMTKKAGASDDAFKEFSNTAAFAGSVLQGNMQVALANLGKVIMPIFSHAVIGVNSLLIAFNKAPPIVHKIVAVIGIFAVGLASVLSTVLGVAIGVAGLIAAGETLAIALGVVAIAAGVLLAAMAPLILAGSAFYLIWTKNIGGIQTQVMTWATQVKLAFDGIVQLFSTGRLSGAVMDDLGKAENAGIKGFVVTIFMWGSRVINFFKGVGKAFSDGFADLGPVVNTIAQEFQHIVRALTPVAKTGSTAKESFQSFGQAGMTIGKALFGVVKFLAEGFANFLHFVRGAVDVFEGFAPALSGAWDAAKALGRAFADLFAVLFGNSTATTDSANGWKLFGEVLGTAVNVAILSVTAAFRVMAGVFSVIGGVIGAIRVVFDGLVQGISLGIQLIGAILTGDGTAAWNIFKLMIDNIVNTIVQTMLKLVAGAAGMVDSLGKLFGKDLGLKASVETFAANNKSNLGTPTGPQVGPVNATTEGAGGSTAPRLAPPTGNNSPGVTQAQQNVDTAAAINALAQKPPPPQPDINLRSTLILDGQAIHENSQKIAARDAGRSYNANQGPEP